MCCATMVLGASFDAHSASRRTWSSGSKTRTSTNTAPTISGTPTTATVEATFYQFVPSASDADGNPLTFSVRNRPAWASFNYATGALSGTAVAGTFSNIVISVSDGQVATSLPAFSITVAALATNTAPQISGNPPTTDSQDTPYSFRPAANDPDGDPLTFSIANQPPWTTFSPSTGALTGTPRAADVGSYGNIVISVTDGSAVASLAAFSITVQPTIVNTAPTITGAPPTSVLQDNTYRFAPSASDADGDALTFRVANLPPWAAFDSATGTLSGKPGAADVGTYSNIVVSVSDGKTVASLPAFSIAVQAYSLGSATLLWTPPTQNLDGSPLTNLAGYKLYWGTAPKSYSKSVTIANPGITSYVIENLQAGTYYFSATAYTTGGTESPLSGEASKTIP